MKEKTYLETKRKETDHMLEELFHSGVTAFTSVLEHMAFVGCETHHQCSDFPQSKFYQPNPSSSLPLIEQRWNGIDLSIPHQPEDICLEIDEHHMF